MILWVGLQQQQQEKICQINIKLPTIHGKYLAGEKLANLVNRELFANILFTTIHRYTENVFGICTDCSLFAKFFLADNFYLYGSPNISCVLQQNNHPLKPLSSTYILYIQHTGMVVSKCPRAFLVLPCARSDARHAWHLNTKKKQNFHLIICSVCLNHTVQSLG